MKYTLFDKCILMINNNNIVEKIINLTDTKSYERVGSGKMTFIVNKEIPPIFCNIFYDSIDILKKANKEKFPNYDNNNDCGLCVDYYSNGIKFKEYYQINNVKNGVYREYYSDGTIHIECEYIDGKIEGIYLEYDQNGRLIKDYKNKNGLLHGICKYNQYSGTLQTINEVTYIDGFKNGDFKTIKIEQNNDNIIENGKFINNFKVEYNYK